MMDCLIDRLVCLLVLIVARYFGMNLQISSNCHLLYSTCPEWHRKSRLKRKCCLSVVTDVYSCAHVQAIVRRRRCGWRICGGDVMQFASGCSSQHAEHHAGAGIQQRTGVRLQTPDEAAGRAAASTEHRQHAHGSVCVWNVDGSQRPTCGGGGVASHRFFRRVDQRIQKVYEYNSRTARTTKWSWNKTVSKRFLNCFGSVSFRCGDSLIHLSGKTRWFVVCPATQSVC